MQWRDVEGLAKKSPLGGIMATFDKGLNWFVAVERTRTINAILPLTVDDQVQ